MCQKHREIKATPLYREEDEGYKDRHSHIWISKRINQGLRMWVLWTWGSWRFCGGCIITYCMRLGLWTPVLVFSVIAVLHTCIVFLYNIISFILCRPAILFLSFLNNEMLFLKVNHYCIIKLVTMYSKAHYISSSAWPFWESWKCVDRKSYISLMPGPWSLCNKHSKRDNSYYSD